MKTRRKLREDLVDSAGLLGKKHKRFYDETRRQKMLDDLLSVAIRMLEAASDAVSTS